MKLLCGSSNPALSAKLANALGCPIVPAEIKRFPDGELYTRLLEPVRGEDLVIVQSTYPDHNALEMLILSSLARDQGAKSVMGVIPYFGYARQDRVFKEGESFTARTMLRHLELALDHIICVNLHKEATLRELSRPGSGTNVSVMGEIGSFLKTKGIDMVLSPDKGAIAYAREAAVTAECPYDNLEKTRLDGMSVVMAPKDLDVRGKRIAIVDDIIATGGTIVKAQEMLRAQGASRVVACCAHGLFTSGGLEKLRPVLDGVLSSDTIEGATNGYSAAGPIARAVKDVVV